MCSQIDIGIFQILPLKLSAGEGIQNIRYLRAKSSEYLSVETMMCAARHELNTCFAQNPAIPVIQIIQRKKRREKPQKYEPAT
ncbi:MAG: hypothetical protein FWF59_00265 [Turicibacter sp.]|nr:hypothetical protein [Turicibacter sp.]